MIADYIQRHKAVDENAPAYSFCDFVKEMRTTDFEDDFQMRAILESQAHLLGTAFQYLMLEGNWKYLSSALRTQRIMRDTIEAMNKFPRLYPSLTAYSKRALIFCRCPFLVPTDSIFISFSMPFLMASTILTLPSFFL